ncbi:acetyltransferase [Empedobacter falsenii]
MLDTYGLIGVIQLLYFKIRTLFVFKNAKIVRFPIRIRGKKFIKVGDNFTTGFNCRIDAYQINSNSDEIIKIGKDVQINDYVHLGAIESLIIEDNVLIASKVFITDHNHGSYSGEEADSPFSIPSERKLHSNPVKIEKNVWIGEYVAVLPGVTIGEGSIIGAMSVVSKDIPPYSIAVGSPARVIKRYNLEKKIWEKI